MTATHTLPALRAAALPAPADNLAAYVRAVNAIPPLSQAEETRLAERLRRHNDTEAARRLVLSNLRLVVGVARGYGGYGLDQTDLIQEGNIGLMKAVRRFNPARGARLATFAVYWIRAEMHEFIVRNWRIVKIATTKAQRKLFFNKRRLSNSTSADNADIAKALNVTAGEVEDMRARLHRTETAAFSTTSEEQPGSEAVLADPRAHDAETLLEQRDRRRLMDDAFNNLSERERDIVAARRLAEPPKTLQTLARQHGVSIERVRQIETAAVKKMARLVKTALTTAAA